jgi:NAD(P)-dependent dehydrogenase (short-subunit alcohol dehydrogenase family)
MTAKDMTGKTVLVTGSNTGLGRVTAEELARRGAKVILANRSEDRTRPVLDAIQKAGGEAVFHPLDLSDLTSVRKSAEAWLARNEPLHVLINNAGLAGQKGLTPDGFERHFGVNHLGPFLFTLLVLPSLRQAGEARIVNVASRAHKRVKRLSFEALQRPTASPTGFPEYGVSKLANVYFSRELGRRLAGSGITTYAVHPGVVASDIWRKVPWPFRSIIKRFMVTNEEGAKTQIRCATDPTLRHETGRYYAESRELALQGLGNDETLCKTLWERSIVWTGAPEP